MGMDNKQKPHEHLRHDWRMSELARDFELMDAWALPATGSLEEFADLCDIVLDPKPANSSTKDGRTPVSVWLSDQLFAIRYKLGEVLGWDDNINTLAIPGSTETSLRERLNEDETAHLTQWEKTHRPGESVEGEATDSPGQLAFRPILKTETEFAAELSNKTLHAVMHLGWIQQGEDSYRGQLGVYVKHRGRLGHCYMAAIAPFRHYLVYPVMLKRIGRDWQAR